MDFTIYPDVQLLAMVWGLFNPLLTGLGTRLDAKPGVKAVFNAVLAVVAGIVVTAIQSPEAGIPVAQAAYAILFAFVSSGAAYARLWKPLGVTGAIQESTKDVGIG